MTQDEYQIKAIALFQEGEYEEAIETMAKSETIGNEEYKKFVNQCKSCLTDQYKYLIIEAINSCDYNTATNYKDEFIEKFGSNSEITNIEIKIPAPKEEIVETKSSESTGSHMCYADNPDNKKETAEIYNTKSSAKLIVAVIGLAVIILIFIFSRSCDSGSYNETIDDYVYVDSAAASVPAEHYAPDTSSVVVEEIVENVPIFAGEWKSTTNDFELELSIEQNSYTNDITVKSCYIYRLDGWEPKGKIENGKLILDDDNGSFHAEIEINGNRLYGKCKAVGNFDTSTFNGNMTMERVDTDNALYKLNRNGGGTYQYITKKEDIIDGCEVLVTSGIDVCLKNGPQIAIIKLYDDYYNENEEQSAEYFIDNYNITIDFGDGGIKVKGRFSKDMSTLQLDNYIVNKPITLHRIGDFNW